jgi:hypothetical protein
MPEKRQWISAVREASGKRGAVKLPVLPGVSVSFAVSLSLAGERPAFDLAFDLALDFDLKRPVKPRWP